MPPTTDAARARWPGLAVAGALLAWHLATMARDLMWFDTGELALVGAQLGLGHPPGQPLYTLVLGAAARIPGIDPLVAMNAVSAICAAACAVPADALARRAVPDVHPGIRAMALLAVGITVTLWDLASRVELYALASLIVLSLMALGARAIDEGRADRRTWLGLGALAGLGVCVNPIMALAGAFAVGLAALPMLVRDGASTAIRATLTAAIGGLLGLAPYAYVAAIAGSTDRLIWGDWQTIDDVVGYLSGRDYAHTDQSAWHLMPEHALDWLAWLAGNGAIGVVLLGVVGWLSTPWLLRRAPLWALPTITGVLFAFALARFHPDVPDFQSYFAPALWLLPAGLVGLARRVGSSPAFITGLALVLAGALVGDRPLHARSRASVDLPRTLAQSWLDAMPPDGILAVEADHLVFPLMYLQEVEGVRRDVVLINVGWAASGWYWRHLYRAHPELTPIDLVAPDSATRLRRLFLAERRRSVRVSTVALAGRVGIRPCPATWGFVLGAGCAAAKDDPAAFQAGLAAGWSGPAGQDPISRRVLAWLGQTRAEGQWALGQTAGALRSLRAGAPTAQAAELPIPPRLGRPPQIPLRAPGVLIGDPAMNLLLGAEALRVLGHDEASTRWREAAGALD